MYCKNCGKEITTMQMCAHTVEQHKGREAWCRQQTMTVGALDGVF